MDYTHTLTVIEPLFIAEYDSLANGYNGNKGGEGGSLGANWWNNGITQVHTQIPPDKTFKRGRLEFNNTGAAIGAAVNALKYWVNDGQHEMMVFKTEELSKGYTKGRLLSKAFNGYDRSSVKGVSWWNNGVQSKMSLTCPGADYVRGRLPSKRRCTAI